MVTNSKRRPECPLDGSGDPVVPGKPSIVDTRPMT